MSSINSSLVISHDSAPASLWMLIASEDSGGLPSAVDLLPVLYRKRPSLWYCLVFQKLFTPKHPNRSTSLLLVPEPEFILHRDAKGTGSPDSGHTLPPVYWTTDPCVSPLWEKKTFTSYSYLQLSFFVFLRVWPGHQSGVKKLRPWLSIIPDIPQEKLDRIPSFQNS